MARLRRVFRLKPAEWGLLIVAYWQLLWARYQMMRMNGEEILGGRRTRDEPNQTPAADQEWIKRRARFINAAARYPFPWAQCLQRSLALRGWLAKGGTHTDLRLGVRRDGGAIAAHAWLECAGEVLNDKAQAVTPYVRLTCGSTHASVQSG